MFRLVPSFVVSIILVQSIVALPFPPDLSTASKDVIIRAEPGPYRLSGDIIPINYNVSLDTKLHLNDDTFTGVVKIQLVPIRTTDKIILHAKQLKIMDIGLTDLETDEYYMLYPEAEDRVLEFLTLTSSHTGEFNLIPGRNYLLEISYTGNLRRDNGGFYLSSYMNDKGDEVYIATTQFEATDARHAFPCFDEPGYKATFDISISHGSQYNAISNMPEKESIVNMDGTTKTVFERTPNMSTYLLAFIVSDFNHIDTTSNQIIHRVLSRPNAKDQRGFALDTSVKALNALATTLDVPFTLPKIDNIAIPDFGAGAMENWGMVTYREEFLLYDPVASTVNTEINIAIMIAHEFAHQWFGDLVTPKWWTHLWLNEGFASLFEYLIVNQIYPEWDIMQNFVTGHFQRALSADARSNARPMSTYVEDPASISGLFDTVSYPKAACVLRMFQHVLGESVFLKGLTSYLRANAQSVVEDTDLFRQLQTAAKDENIAGIQNDKLTEFFTSWTDQGGYPVLTVTRDYSSGSFKITQEFFDGTNKPTVQRTFVTPFNYVYGNKADFENTQPDGFLTGESITVEKAPSSNHDGDDWLLLNKQLTGYYRVNYDTRNWDLLAKALKNDHKKFDVSNRAQLIADSFALVLANRLDLSKSFALIEYIRNEEEFAPWASANNVFTSIHSYFMGDKSYDLLQYYIGHLIGKYYETVGITEAKNDTVHRKLTRTIAINWACRANVGKCLEETNSRLIQVIKTKVEIEPSLKVPIFCNGLITGGEEEFQYVFWRIMNSTDQAERRQLMPTLGCSRNDSLLLEFARTATAYSPDINYRIQERTNVLSAIIDKNEIGLWAAIEYLMEDHQGYYSLGAAGFMDSNPLLTIMSSIASRIYTKELEEKFKRLVDAVKTGPAGNAPQLNNMLNTVQNNLRWADSNREQYFDWLDRYRNSAGSVVVSSCVLAITAVVSLCSSYF